MLLLGGLFIAVFVYTTVKEVQKRKQAEQERLAKVAEYNRLITSGREDEALRQFHSKKYTRHPSFCKCIKCSIKRTFTS